MIKRNGGIKDDNEECLDEIIHRTMYAILFTLRHLQSSADGSAFIS